MALERVDSPEGKRPQVEVSGRLAAKRSSRRLVTEGASRASPAATTWMASTRSSGGTSLSRKPLAPARRAESTYSSRSKVVRISTRTGSWTPPPARRRVASIPSMPGMRMSSSTTSARTWPASRTASAPSAASPTTSRPGSASRIIRNPVRISGWSSAIRTLMITAASLRPAVQGQPGGDPVASAGAAAGLEGAAEQGHPLAHADEAVPRPATLPVGICRPSAGGRLPAVAGDAVGVEGDHDQAVGPGRGPAAAVVGDLDLQDLAAVADADLGPGRAGVPERVGQGLLDDPVGRQVDPGRQGPRLALDRHLDRQAGLPGRPGQRLQVGEARLGGEVGAVLLLAVAQQPQQPAQLDQGLA